MVNYNYRYWQFFLALISLSVLLASLYFQYIKDLRPCPLCLMQRLGVILEVILCFAALLMSRVRPQRVTAVLQMSIAFAGLYFAGRQLWLQSLPHDQIPACLPGLEILLHYFPWQDIFHALLWGSADCAESAWQFLGLSMPAWAALYFIGMIGAVGFMYVTLNRRDPPDK